MDDRTGQPPLGIFYKNSFLHQTRLPGALLFAGPPCSYFVFMSSSIHKRSRLGPRGDESHCGVRLGNLLTENLAVAVRALLQIRDVKGRHRAARVKRYVQPPIVGGPHS